MAETTKRAIRENMAITSQLKKMSAKIVDLIAENQTLSSKINKIKLNNSLLIDSEKELVKRNIANQKIVKMLVDKLIESDHILEIAFETEKAIKDFDKGNAEKYDSAPHHNIKGGEKGTLTDAMKDEMENLQYDYNVLAARLSEISIVGSDLQSIMNEITSNANTDNMQDIMEYIQSNLKLISLRLFKHINERMTALTTFETAAENPDPQIAVLVNSENVNENTKQTPEELSNSQVESHFKEENQEVSHDNENPSPDVKKRTSIKSPTVTFEEKIKNKQEESNIKSIQLPVVSPIAQRKVIPYRSENAEGDTKVKKNIGCQTNALPFGPSTNPEYLLGEVRPWGPPAECLPLKGLGMYKPKVNKLKPIPN